MKKAALFIFEVLSFLCFYSVSLSSASRAASLGVNIEMQYESWSYTHKVNTENGTNTYGNANNDVTYTFSIAQPSIIVIDHSGSTLNKTCIHLKYSYSLMDVEQGWSEYIEGSSMLEESTALIERMMTYYPMADDLQRDLDALQEGQAFFCMQLPAGFYTLVSEGQMCEEGGNGKIKTNIRVYHLGDSPQEALDLGTVNTTFEEEILYYSWPKQNTSKEFYVKIAVPKFMEITIDGVSPRGTASKLFFMSEELSELARSDEYPVVDDFFPQMSGLKTPAGTYYVKSKTGSGLGLVGLNVRTNFRHPDQSLPFALDDKHNYIASYIPVSKSSSINDPKVTGLSRVIVDYYDRLGRHEESVIRCGSPIGNDLVQKYINYDMHGRQACVISPTPSSKIGGTFIGMEENITNAADFYLDSIPYSTIEYSPDMIGRVTSECGPGHKWRENDKKVVMSYTTEPLEHFVVNGSRENPELILVQPYEKGTLQIVEKEDEDGNFLKKYIDCFGKILCEETPAGKTFYVYDLYDNLCFVLPPEISNCAVVDISCIYDRAYCYRYDSKNRCIGKKLPGIGWTEYIYDLLGNLIYSQDATQKEAGEWHVSIPDVFGRTAITGIFTGEVSRAVVSETIVRATAYANTYGYILNGIGFDDLDILQINFYDSYDFRGSYFFNDNRLEYIADTLFSQMRGHVYDVLPHKDLLTGTICFPCGDNRSEVTVYYYDDRNRPVQIRSRTLDYGFRSVKLKYAYSGEVLLKEYVSQPSFEAEIDTLRTIMEYDNMGRLVSQVDEFNGGSYAIQSFNYDAIGRLECRKIGPFGKIAKEKFSYGVRDELTKMSSSSSLAGTLMEMVLRSHSPRFIETEPSYSGNITEQEWRYGDTDSVKTYTFKYDSLSRLTGATLYNGEIVTDAYTEKGICYDTDGNVLSLNRTSEGQIDSVTYVYSNGRLLSVCSTGLEQGQFCYDKSGRVIHDGAFGLDILWNSLGQISQVKNKDSICVMYTYTPDGTKISSLDLEGNGLLYDGPFIYKIDRDSIVLESVAFKGGRFCVSDTGGMEVQYHITDHLGSVRLVINDEGENIERNNYYPFGLRWNDGSLLNNQNLYRYNGKEDQRYFGLPYLDYGARMYVPRMTRWLSPDPFAEQYYNSSPYSFCAGNPINYVDLDGKERRLVYNMKKNEIIIQATFYHEIGITKEVHAALNMFNNMSGLKYADDDGNVYKVKFDLIGERNSSPSKAARGNPAGNYIELSNSLGITENGDRRLGATWKNHIKIDEDFINNIIVVSHEVGHALGAALPDENGNDNHSDYGLMAPSVDDPNLNTYLDQKSVDEIIQDGQGPMVVQNSWLDAVLQIFK